MTDEDLLNLFFHSLATVARFSLFMRIYLNPSNKGKVHTGSDDTWQWFTSGDFLLALFNDGFVFHIVRLYKANSFYYTEQQYYLCNYIIHSPQATTCASVLPCCCKIASPVFWKKLKAQLSQPFIESHSGLLKPRVSWRRSTGCLPLTVLVPTLHITGMISEKINSFASMHRHQPHTYGLSVLIYSGQGKYRSKHCHFSSSTERTQVTCCEHDSCTSWLV